jgi:hypothetical protein
MFHAAQVLEISVPCPRFRGHARRGELAAPARRRLSPRGVIVGLAVLGVAALATSASGQSVGSGTLTPFVIGFDVVTGPGGAVGGVSIDSKGVLARIDADATGKLREARRRAWRELPGELDRYSPLRKVSLRRLNDALAERAALRLAPAGEMQHLAGLVRIEYVFVHPEQRDIVLAGPAEGWMPDEHGSFIGRTTGRPVMHLDDLVVALRSADAAAGRGIRCSIDPAREGTERLARLVSSRGLAMSPHTVARLETTLGPQEITVSGVPATSRFARVMVAADFRMKQLAMHFEPSPVDGLKSFMQLLAEDATAVPRDMMPRWWLAVNYDPLLRDEEGLAWQLRGAGVRALAEEALLKPAAAKGAAAAPAPAERSHVQDWADMLTREYPALARHVPVFAELRQCMDAAVVAALVRHERLLERADCPLPRLIGPDAIPVAEYRAPRTVASRASYFPRGQEWIISLSGGIEIDAGSVVNNVEEKADLAALRRQAIKRDAASWWWD